MKYAYPLLTPECDAALPAASGDAEVLLPRLRQLGYSGVEPFVRDPSAFDADRFARAVESSGLTVCAVGSGPLAVEDGLSLCSPDPDLRRRAIERTKRVVDFAARFGSQVNIGKLRGMLGSSDREESADRRDAAFREICAYARDHHVAITLEPQTMTVVDNLNTTREALDWMSAMALPNLYVMIDTLHAHCDDPDLPSSIVTARKLLLHIHFSDTGRRAPGSGQIDFKALLHLLHAVEYRRFITIEIKQSPTMEDAARRAIDYLRYLEECIGA